MSNPLDIIQTYNGRHNDLLQSPNGPVKALVWARVSTDMQGERNLSMPEQLRQIQKYAEKHEIKIVKEYSEAASAYQKSSKRVEFLKMLEHAKNDPEITAILIHDFSRFSRDGIEARIMLRDLHERGVKVISLNDMEFDNESPTAVYLEAITFAKNEAYSREVAFHTRKGCRSNVNTRDKETGWCYKNGGIAPWGYKAVRLERGYERKGVPIIKVVWELDDTIVAGLPVHEWTRYMLVELAMKGASLANIQDFLNKNEIPAKTNRHWSLSSIKSLLELPRLIGYCGYGVWNVRKKNGAFKPAEEWEIVENAHPAIISMDEAKAILDMREKMSKEKRFDNGFSRSNKSQYLLSGGLFICGRCGANMVGFKKDKDSPYYVCGSIQYRRGLGCGSGVYVPQIEIEQEVIDGLAELMIGFSASDKFINKVNKELQLIWEEKTGIKTGIKKELKEVDAKIRNIYDAIEKGIEIDSEINSRLSMLKTRKQEIENISTTKKDPPKIDSRQLKRMWENYADVIKAGDHSESKRLLRTCVESIKLDPDELEVNVQYKVPNPVEDYNLAGANMQPQTWRMANQEKIVIFNNLMPYCVRSVFDKSEQDFILHILRAIGSHSNVIITKV